MLRVWRFCRAWCATTRPSAPPRSATRSRHRPRDQRLRLSGLASRGLDRWRAADGRAASVEGVEGRFARSRATQKIFRAMQRYGLIVADNGSDMYISGTFDTRWP